MGSFLHPFFPPTGGTEFVVVLFIYFSFGGSVSMMGDAFWWMVKVDLELRCSVGVGGW